jgi:cyclophilin family peptidyl-prolyl cis-trans isomerase
MSVAAFRVFVCSWLIAAAAVHPAAGQTRLAILQAEDRRAPAANDVATLRSGAHSPDPQTRRLAIRALGRLERAALIADIVPGLRHELPEIRSESANAVAQAARNADRRAVDSAQASLAARLKAENDSDVRAALCEAIGRLPYTAPEQIQDAERALVDVAERAGTVTDRLGVAKAFEALARTAQKIQPLSEDAAALVRRLVTPTSGEASSGSRVRRLALEALVTANGVDSATLTAAAHDPDAQVRRIAMRAAAAPNHPQTAADGPVLSAGLDDSAAMVRLEALRGNRSCDRTIAAAADRDVHVALAALDQLARCGSSADAAAAISLLEHAVDDLSDAGSPRGWHRAAHALVALASAAPERGAAKLPQFTGSSIWQLRMYAARAAAASNDRAALEKLATTDADDNVREAAVEGLTRVAAHDADAVYVSELIRSGYQVVRAAALALEGTPNADAAAPALRAALQRLVAEGRDNSHDARAAIEKTLSSVGAESARPSAGRPSARQSLSPRPGGRSAAAGRKGRATVASDGAGAGEAGSAPAIPGGASSSTGGATSAPTMTVEELRRLASPRARIAIRGVGTFELALFTSEAPATVLRFAHLAESGYYNGLTFHRVVPNFVIQGGSPGANEYIGDAGYMRDEVGLWPHVRGAVGISTRGHDTGDAQIFIDLVDNPRLDHVYTVFAQVLNGIDVVDRILEGDVIERIEIIP